MDYIDLIKNWHLKASDDDYFSKFIFEYLAFIAYLKKVKFTNTRVDREAIQKFKRDEIKDVYLSLVRSNRDIQEAWQRIINELNITRLGNVSRNSEGVEEIEYWNCSQNKLSSKTEIDKNKELGKIHSLEDWENMVEFWYSIRNNLFHGAKNPRDQRDQLLVENGYKTLHPLMEIFIFSKNKSY